MASAGLGLVKKIGRFDIFADDDHILGSGATGTVYSGIDPFNDDNPVAAKKLTIFKEFLDEGGYEKEAELLLYTIPPHENIIKLHEFAKKEYRRGTTAMVDLWMVMDYCEHSSMDTFAESRSLDEDQKLDIMYQSSLAVEHLHKHDVTHRDIKPENILLTGDVNQPVVKLADFGAASIVERVAGKSLTLHSLAGTDGYMAPEQLVLKNHTFHYDSSVDIFSLGLSHLSLLESRKGSLMSVLTVNNISLGRAMRRMQDEFGTTWSGFSPNIAKPTDSPLATEIKGIIKKMIQTEPSDRIKISEVVQRLAALRTRVAQAQEKDVHGPDVRPKTQSSSRKTPVSRTSSTQQTRTIESENVESQNARDAKHPGTSQKAAVKSHTPGDTKQSGTSQKPVVKSKTPGDTKQPGTSQKPVVKSQTPGDTKQPGTSQKAAVNSQTPGDTKQSTTASGRPLAAEKSSQASASTESGTSVKKVSSRVTSGVPTSVQRITRHDLSFDVDCRAGLGEHGDIVLEDNDRVYKMTHNGQEYAGTLNMESPNKHDYCKKAVDANHRTLLQAKKDSDTVCYNDAGEEVYKLKHQGLLINSVGGELFYGKEKRWPNNDLWKIKVHRATTPAGASRQAGTSTRPVTLQPPAPHRWGKWLSVCRVQGGYAVTEWYTNSLDIFTTEGRQTRHVKLPYYPALRNAITSCPSGHLLIAEYDTPPTIHIHELSGQEVGRFTHQDLQLKDDVWVHGICYSHEDGLLHLCAGDDWDNIKSLHAFRVLFK